MDPANLTRRLKERATREGFSAVAVAAAEVHEHAAALGTWLQKGRHASMSWMEREPEKRCDPRLLLPGCRSVVALAMNYWPGRGRGGGGGRVARYAWGRDYHRVIGRKAALLASWLTDTTGEAAISCVDISPVLERGWAERAGLGWIGKNSNLITREFGSWLLLAEILTSAEMVPDSGPHRSYCGSCSACIAACPTGAIVADGVVDANLCISYWTIEHRGDIPESMRPLIGDWMFGCDICQEVCPWNIKFARPTAGSTLERRADLQSLDPEKMLGLQEDGFRARYSGSALMRAKWEGLRRNALIVRDNLRRE
jgi:epoxyqueuosine reductase